MRPEGRYTQRPLGGLGTGSVEPDGDLVGWRVRRLMRAGIDADLAAAIAADCAIDLHAMIELAEQGCPPELAARILAPVDRERSPC